MTTEKPAGLVRAIGRWTLAGLVLDANIGSGIFGLPSVVSGYVGRAGPWAYLLAAAGVGVIMACFAEVGSRFREAGGPYLYAREAFGRLAGIQVAWVAWLVRLTAAAANANLFVITCAVGLAASQRLPRLPHSDCVCGLPGCCQLSRGENRARGFSNFFIGGEAGALCSSGFFRLIFFRAGAPASPFSAAPGSPGHAVLVLVFAYGGFEAALFPMGEAKDPLARRPFCSLYRDCGDDGALHVDSGCATGWSRRRPRRPTGRRPPRRRGSVGAWGAAFMTLGALISVYGYLGSMMLNVPRRYFRARRARGFSRRVHARYRTPYVSIVLFAG